MTAMSGDSAHQNLRWSTQLRILSEDETPHLKGDRIILPQSALEQLLAAATVITGVDSRPQPEFDPFNPHTFAAERQVRQQTIERQQNLPHPLHFRIVNPDNGNILYTGIREFSAPEGTIGISPFVRSSLGVSVRDGPKSGVAGSHGNLTVHLEILSKGSFVKLRPLEAGYDVEDWKSFLEQHMRDTYTSLTSGEEITITAGKDRFRFLVDELKPSKEAISLVDTDLEVDIEPLSEEQARETLQKLVKSGQKGSQTEGGSSVGGKIEVGSSKEGQVSPSDYVDYVIESWDNDQDLEIEVTRRGDVGDLDLFVTPLSPRYRSKPREESYVLGNFTSEPSKSIKISKSNVAFENAESISISVRAWSTKESDAARASGPIPYTLSVAVSSITNGHAETTIEDDSTVSADEERCSNCQQLVPKRTMFLHENYCLRNNVVCKQCHNVFQKASDEWKSHWHCPHDDAFGNDVISHEKHDSLLHTSRACPACDYIASNVPDLAFHRTTSCPSKLILCQFCHLQVPQKGPEDPEQESAEVLLSGLTPHEVSDGARTTECHLCSRIVRLRDMAVHLQHHNIQRLSRTPPHICKNSNCGRTVDHISRTGDVTVKSLNDLGLCETCFGPLYNSQYDPEGKALRRRVERKYLTQLLTGCNQPWCRNELCKTGRNLLSHGQSEPIGSKEASGIIKPLLDGLKRSDVPIQLCTDQASQTRRSMAEMLAAEGADSGSAGKGKAKEGTVPGHGYELPWCIAALDIEAGNLDRARAWLQGFAPRRDETRR